MAEAREVGWDDRTDVFEKVNHLDMRIRDRY
jgi:hypothetical protein